MQKGTQLKNWFFAIVMMLIIFMASSTPGQVINAAGLGPNIYHIEGHSLLFFLLCLSYFKAVKKVPAAVLLTFIFAMTDEFHQRFVPLRSASWDDILVDTLAGLAAGFIIWKLQPILPKKLTNWLNS